MHREDAPWPPGAPPSLGWALAWPHRCQALAAPRLSLRSPYPEKCAALRLFRSREPARAIPAPSQPEEITIRQNPSP